MGELIRNGYDLAEMLEGFLGQAKTFNSQILVDAVGHSLIACSELRAKFGSLYQNEFGHLEDALNAVKTNVFIENLTQGNVNFVQSKIDRLKAVLLELSKLEI